MEENIKVVQQYFDALASGNFELLASLFSENIIWHQPGKGELSKTYQGKEEVFNLFGKFMEISDATFKIDRVDSIMANGPFIAASIHFSASKKSGESVSMSGVDLIRVENGKLSEVYLFSSDQSEEDSFWKH